MGRCGTASLQVPRPAPSCCAPLPCFAEHYALILSGVPAAADEPLDVRCVHFTVRCCFAWEGTNILTSDERCVSPSDIALMREQT